MMITSESRRCWQEHDREPSRRHCQSRRRTRACTVSTACVAAAGVAESVRDVYLAPFPTLVPPLAMCASPHPTTSPIALPRSKTELPTPTSSPLGLLLPPAPSLSLDGFSFRYRQQLRIRLAARTKPHPCTNTVWENFSFFACTDSPAGGMRMSASRVRITTRFSYS